MCKQSISPKNILLSVLNPNARKRPNNSWDYFDYLLMELFWL